MSLSALARADLGQESQWHPYVALVQQTIRARCKGNVGGGSTPGADPGDTPSVPLNPLLEVGVAKDSKNSDGTTSRTRIFTKPAAGPNLNFGKEF